MLRPRNGTTPPNDYPPEPDTPLSHYSPTLSGPLDIKEDVPPMNDLYEEKSGLAGQGQGGATHGLGLASRRGEKAPSITINATSLGGRSNGQVKRLGASSAALQGKSPDDTGLSQRAWMIVGVLVTLLFFSRHLLRKLLSGIGGRD